MNKLIAAGAALALALCATAAAAQDKKKLEIIVFPGGFNWPLWTAQQEGLFAKEGLEVNLTPTPNSQFQLTETHNGKFHIAMTAIDNVIAYQEEQGPVKLDKPEFFAFMGGDNGFLSLVTVPEVKKFSDLKGKTLSVDAMTTGYAFVLRDLIARNKLKQTDVTYVPAGGVLERWRALDEKKHAGTMLISPFDVLAKAKGNNILARAADVYGHYQGLVGAARRSWAKQNEKELVGYIRAYRGAVAWLYDRKNKDKAIALLRAKLPNMDEKTAEATYGVLLGDKGGFFRNAGIDWAGVNTVLALRAKYAEPKKKLGEGSKYVDLAYYNKATPKK